PRTRKLPTYTRPERKYVVDLMNKFELCYRLADGAILVPDLLPEKEPPGIVPQQADVRFYFEYDFLPAVVMPRFMVQSSADLQPDLCWRTGAVLKNASFDCVAVVRRDSHRRRIYIDVTGRQPRDYLSVIRGRIIAINRSFEKLPFTEWIPLPDEPAHAVKYADLIGHEHSGREEKFVGELEKGYSVAKLLSSIETRQQTKETAERIIYAKEYHEDHGMKIEKVKITGGHVNFADRIEKIEYNESLGMGEKELAELKAALKRLPGDKAAELDRQAGELQKAETQEQKTSISRRILKFLVDNGVAVAKDLTVEVLKSILTGKG
ncbi:MAG: hypothetical protein JSU94_15315, partial [Phycisphaerales bacterium]